MMMKKLISAILILALLAGLATQASAIEIVIGPVEHPIGEEGSDLSWDLTEDGTLTISGTGDMLHTNANSTMPWFDTPETIRRVIIEEGVTSITPYCFWHCENLESAQLADTIRSIGAGAFEYCKKLKSFRVPRDCTDLRSAFIKGCPDMETLEVAPGNTAYVMKDGGLYTADMKHLLATEADLTGTFVLPDTLEQDSYLRSALGNLHHIEKIVIPTSLRLDGGYFNNCGALKEFALSGSGHYSVKDGILYSEDGNTIIAYPGGKPGPFTIPENVTAIGECAFSGTQTLERLDIPKTVKTVGDSAFSCCAKLRELNIEAQLRELPAASCGWNPLLTQITLPDSLVRIDVNALQCCTALTDIEIPASVEEIQSSAFEDCTSLRQMFLPKGLVTLGTSVFMGCSSLKAIHFLGGPPHRSGASPFDNWKNYQEIHAHGWGTDSFFGTNVVECDFIEEEGGTVCSVCGAKTSLKIPEDHSFTPWSLTEDGTLYERFCTKCGLRQTMDGHHPITAPTVSDNRDQQDYFVWTSTVKSSLIPNPDGSLTRVEYNDGRLVCETYSAEGKFLSGKTLPMELPLYGGFCAGKNYNYVAYGQKNPEELGSMETVRVVKYTKDWQRVDSGCIHESNTWLPFDAGSLRMAEVGDELYIDTSHAMYNYCGLHHQANFLLHFHTPDMSLVESRNLISNTNHGYVSHSFNQFIAVSGDHILTLEQEECGSRERAALILVQSDGESFPDFSGKTRIIHAFDFAPGDGNSTGASLGAFYALPNGNLLTAGNSVDRSSTDMKGQRNIFISCVSGFDSPQENVQLRWLTDYAADAAVKVSTPQAVVLPDGSGLAVLWTENDVLHYAFTDAEGNVLGNEILTADAALSDCVPVLSGDRFLWYVTENTTPVFYALEARPGGRITRINRAEKPAEPEKPEENTVFEDVPADAYFADAVRWAYENGVALGTDVGIFSPEADCTRAEALTFLWRALGSPEPAEVKTSFTDVEPGSYYEKAVAWAEEKGVANGMEDHQFCPDGTVTRAQFVTFLWRVSEEPEPPAGTAGFTDLEPGSYYEKAVLWAAAGGIANGMTEHTFEPETCCIRAHVVTFLYRYRR